jgi:hypothetical protein
MLSQAGGAAVSPDILRATTLARWLDRRWLDPALGFVVPGLGDIAGAVLGLYIVRVAARHGAPNVVLARMLLGLALDIVVGAVPVFGDLLDIYSRPNQRNARLLTQRWADGRIRSRFADVMVLLAAVSLLIGACGIPLVALWMTAVFLEY